MSVSRENGRKKLKTGRSADSLFYPFRALGFIVDDKPFSIYKANDETFCVTSIYKSFQVYKADHLNVVFVSPPHPHKIRAITNIRKTTYVASGNCLYRWKNRNKEMKFVTNGDYKIDLIFNFADTLILTTDEKNILRVYTKDLELNTLIDFKDKSITSLLHPSTYINKLLVGTREGHLELWNLQSKKLIYQFEKFVGTAITCLAEAPAIDVVGIGFADGRIVVHNIKYDKTIITFQQAEGVVTSLSFRTDRNPFLVSGTHAGSVAIWDLEEKKLVTIMSNAHSGSVTCAKFLSGEPVMLTSGVDNSLKMWIFDQMDGSARLLRSRAGHSAPPTFLKNYSPTPVMLTTGQDLSVRYINVSAPKYNFLMSQSKIAKKLHATGVTMNDLKLSSIQDMACSITKEGLWDNMVTCHADSRKAFTWNIKNKTLGQHTLVSTSPGKGAVKAVAISVCGNFAVLGSQCGWIDVYNLQSGSHRGNCPTNEFAHEAAITSIFVDNLNQHIISTSLDGTIKIWDFSMRKLTKEINVGMPINKALFHSDSSLLAVMPDDFTIKIYDLDSQKLVRNLEGHDSPITCAIFTPDSRWIISSSTDGTLRVWDLPTGQLVEWYTVKKPITSMSFTPAGNFLVTTHVGSVGVYLWANSNYYSNYYIRPVNGKPKELLMPGAVSEDDHVVDDSNLEDVPTMEQNDEMELEMEESLAKEGLVTMSGVPNARWTSIPDWEEIKKRNKPIEPVKKPEKAPFFLPTQTSLEGTKFVLPDKEESDEFFGTKIMTLQDDLSTKSKFVQALEASDATNDFTEPFAILKDLPPAGIDFEFRTLSLQHEYKHLRLIMRMINSLLDTNHNFELLQAYLNLFLKIHGDLIAKEEVLHQLAAQLKQKQRERWHHIQYMFQNSLCLVKFLSNLQMN